MPIRAKSRSPELIRSRNLKCAQNLTCAHILHSWMEDKVIMIPFPRDICSRDIISYFCSTHDQGFFKLLTHLAVYPGPFIKTHTKMTAWTGVKDKICMGWFRECKQFSLFDLDLWPTTLTYNPRLVKVKVDPHAKKQGQRSNDSNMRVPTVNGHTHTHTHGRNVLSPLLHCR